MKRLSLATKAFLLLLFKNDVSLSLRHDDKELTFEHGVFKKNAVFLRTLRDRGGVPDYVLNQYKAILNDYNFEEN